MKDIDWSAVVLRVFEILLAALALVRFLFWPRMKDAIGEVVDKKLEPVFTILRDTRTSVHALRDSLQEREIEVAAITRDVAANRRDIDRLDRERTAE